VTIREHLTSRDVRDEAMLRLGIDEGALAAAPRITSQMRMIERTIRGGRDAKAPYGPGGDLTTSWPNYLDASDHADARKVRDAYYALPRYMRTRLPIEAFCVAAGVSPLTVLEILTAVIVRQGTQASTVIAAVNHPRVVEKTVEMALTDDGIEDRTMLHKHAGFLPTASGPKTNIVVTQNASATAQAASVAAPPPEQTIRRLADRFNMARALPEAVTEPMPERSVAAEVVEVEADDVRED
jgi:hypothetical protein